MQLASFTVGTGTTGTVLLHGFLGTGRNLRTLAQRWAEADASRRFLLPDLRGHGESPRPTETTDLAEMGADVIETARAQGLTGPLELIGHSLGGRVALAAMQSAPEDVSRVTLLDISPSAIADELSESGAVLKILRQAPQSTPDRKTMRAWLLEHGLSAALADWLLMNLVATKGGVEWRFDREALAQLHDRVNHEELWPVVQARGGDIRCIRGSRSPYVSDAELQRLTRAGCDVHTLEGAGHYVHVDALEELLRILRS